MDSDFLAPEGGWTLIPSPSKGGVDSDSLALEGEGVDSDSLALQGGGGRVRGLGFAEVVDSDVGVLEVTCALSPG